MSIDRNRKAPSERRLPAFEEIVGFSEVPASDVDALKIPFITAYLEEHRAEVEHHHATFLAGVDGSAPPPPRDEPGQHPIMRLNEQIQAYFAERVDGPLFRALAEAVPEYAELQGRPIQPIAKRPEPEPIQSLEDLLRLEDETTEMDPGELARMDRFAELSERDDVKAILEQEYRPMQRRAQEMALKLFETIVAEAQAAMVDESLRP